MREYSDRVLPGIDGLKPEAEKPASPPPLKWRGLRRVHAVKIRSLDGRRSSHADGTSPCRLAVHAFPGHRLRRARLRSHLGEWPDLYRRGPPSFLLECARPARRRDSARAECHLHLDKVEEAKIWDVEAFVKQQGDVGADPILGVGKFKHKAFAERFGVSVPARGGAGPDGLVYQDGQRVIIRPRGFFLWQTRETVGTPEIDPRLICFIRNSGGDCRVYATEEAHVS
jgi:hypothetical protein